MAAAHRGRSGGGFVSVASAGSDVASNGDLRGEREGEAAVGGARQRGGVAAVTGEGRWRRGSDRGCRHGGFYRRHNGVRAAPPRSANESATHGDRANDRWPPPSGEFSK
jgi:hypothetical protein